MAAVLSAFLCDSVLAEAMLAMVWHFHGLEAQTDDGQLRVQESRHHSTGAVTLGIQSTQRGWPMQVVKKEAPTSQYYRLRLSDSVHTIQAIIAQHDVLNWALKSGESFDDILPGTLLQVDIGKVILKPNRGKGTQKFAVPFVILSSFKVVGCQGENIFGRPSHIYKERQLRAVNASLAWWAARESKPLLEKYAESLIKLHSDFVKRHGDRLSDRYLSWLCDKLGEDSNDADREAVQTLAKHVPAVLGVRHSQELSLSLSIPTASCIPENLWPRSDGLKVAALEERGRKIDGKGDEEIESVFGPASSQLHPSSVISAEDYREREIENFSFASRAGSVAHSPTTPLQEARSGKGQAAVSSRPSILSPTFSPFKRRDGAIRKEQLSLITDKNESAWTTAKSNGSCHQRVPETTLQSILAQLREASTQKAVAKKKAAKQPTTAIAVQSIEEDDAPPPASQETVHASEWGSSPLEQSKCQMPPDTGDERSPSPGSPIVIDSSHIVDSTLSTSAYQPRIDREQGIAEAAGYPLDEEGSASPSPASIPAPAPAPALAPIPIPSTPAVQIPATASQPEPPVSIQVPATTDRPSIGSTARKRRSAEFEADLDGTEPVRASPEDPKHAIKRARAAFMIEKQAERAGAGETTAAASSSSPAMVSNAAPAPAPTPASVDAAAFASPATLASGAVPTSTSPPPTTPYVAPTPAPAPESASAPAASLPATPAPVPAPTPTLASVLASAPISTPDPPTPLAVEEHEEASLHAQFAAAYPTYDGTAAHFGALARAAAAASAAGRLPQYALDDFVLRHRTAFAPYVAERLAEGATQVASYDVFWAREVRNLQATRGVLNAGNVRTAAAAAAAGSLEEEGHGETFDADRKGERRRMKANVNAKGEKGERREKREKEKRATKVFAAFAAKKTKI